MSFEKSVLPFFKLRTTFRKLFNFMNKITTFSSHFEVPVTALGDWRAFGLPNGGHLVWVEIRDLHAVMYYFLKIMDLFL